jgi:hypothetical protein
MGLQLYSGYCDAVKNKPVADLQQVYDVSVIDAVWTAF